MTLNPVSSRPWVLFKRSGKSPVFNNDSRFGPVSTVFFFSWENEFRQVIGLVCLFDLEINIFFTQEFYAWAGPGYPRLAV
jgi:hypothetical protein